MKRPRFVDIYMSLAKALSLRSTCKRLQVGAVIASTDYRYIYGIGYNGNAEGFDNKCDNDEEGKCGCIHAEANAIINCNTSRETPKVVFITHSPCIMCAKMLVNLGGVKQVYYYQKYRDDAGIKVLTSAGIYTSVVEKSLTCMKAQEWNDKYPVGQLVELIEDNGSVTHTKTRSEAWELGHGKPVIMVVGKSGGYLLSRIRAR